MRRIAKPLALLSLLFLLSSPIMSQSRPRRVEPRSTPTDPPKSNTRPPVLAGGSTNTGTSQPTEPTGPAIPDNVEVSEGDIVRVNTTLITVPVSVVDRAGKYVPDLFKEDFKIFENNVEQDIAYFAPTEQPFTVALVLDTSASTQFKIDEIQNAAIAFVEQLRRDDKVLVVSFDQSIRVLTEATSDRAVLRRAIMRARTGGGTKLYEAVDFVLNQRLNRIKGRKAIVLFTDGVDTASERATYESTLSEAEEADALIYPIQYNTLNDGGSGGGIIPAMRIPIPGTGGKISFPMPGSGGVGGGPGSGTSKADYAHGDRYLGELAYKTGARRHRADTLYNLEQAFSLIAEELRIQYSLGYYPKSPGKKGERRGIRVRVMRPNLAVRARDNYIVDPDRGMAPENDPKPAPAIRKNPLAERAGPN